MKVQDPFLKAYHDFRESIDLCKGGMMPDVDNLVWYLLMGVPPVPADEDPSENAQMEAMDQRVTILKALFVESNRFATDDFLDQGLARYDEANRTAKALLMTGNKPVVKGK